MGFPNIGPPRKQLDLHDLIIDSWILILFCVSDSSQYDSEKDLRRRFEVTQNANSSELPKRKWGLMTRINWRGGLATMMNLKSSFQIYYSTNCFCYFSLLVWTTSMISYRTSFSNNRKYRSQKLLASNDF